MQITEFLAIDVATVSMVIGHSYSATTLKLSSMIITSTLHTHNKKLLCTHDKNLLYHILKIICGLREASKENKTIRDGGIAP